MLEGYGQVHGRFQGGRFHHLDLRLHRFTQVVGEDVSFLGVWDRRDASEMLAEALGVVCHSTGATN